MRATFEAQQQEFTARHLKQAILAQHIEQPREQALMHRHNAHRIHHHAFARAKFHTQFLQSLRDIRGADGIQFGIQGCILSKIILVG